MNLAPARGTYQTSSSFRFGFIGRQVIYLIAGAFLVASNCTLVNAGKEPPNWDKLLEKGYQQLTLGNTTVAADFFSAKLQKYPDCAPCHFGYGKSLKRLGKTSEAKEEFRKATELDSNMADAFYELGVLQESDKDYDSAATNFEHYLSLKPDAAQRQNIPDRIRFCKEHQ
jgi:tetratricopeptide (TPR) repeat protein